MSSPVTFILGAEYLPLLAEAGPASRLRLAARLEGVQRRLSQTAALEGPDALALGLREGKWRDVEVTVRHAWMASRVAVVGKGSNCRATGLLDALDLTEERTPPDAEDELLSQVCAELCILILMFERAWSSALLDHGGSLLRVESFAVKLTPLKLKDIEELRMSRELIETNERVLLAWVEYQSSLILRGVDLFAEQGVLSAAEACGIAARFSRLCVEAVGGAMPEPTFAQPVEFPSEIGGLLRGEGVGLSPLGYRDLLRLARPVLNAGQAPDPIRVARGLSLPHIQWLSNLLRFLILKGTGHPRTRADLAFAVALMPPSSPPLGVTRKVRMHEATLLNGVLEEPGSEAVNELSAILGECRGLDECGAAAATDLAWALCDDTDGTPNCLVSLTHDTSVLCALRRTKQPFRFILPVVREGRTLDDLGNPGWMLMAVDEEGVRTSRMLEENIAPSVSPEASEGASWLDTPTVADTSAIGNGVLRELPGRGPVVVLLMGAPMEDLGTGISQWVTVGEQALHVLFSDLARSSTMSSLLKASLGERNTDEQKPSHRAVVLLGIDGWSETDRHSILWLFSQAALAQWVPDDLEFRVEDPKRLPKVYFDKVLGSKVDVGDGVGGTIHTRAESAKRRAAVARGLK